MSFCGGGGLYVADLDDDGNFISSYRPVGRDIPIQEKIINSHLKGFEVYKIEKGIKFQSAANIELDGVAGQILKQLQFSQQLKRNRKMQLKKFKENMNKLICAEIRDKTLEEIHSDYPQGSIVPFSINRDKYEMILSLSGNFNEKINEFNSIVKNYTNEEEEFTPFDFNKLYDFKIYNESEIDEQIEIVEYYFKVLMSFLILFRDEYKREEIKTMFDIQFKI